MNIKWLLVGSLPNQLGRKEHEKDPTPKALFDIKVTLSFVLRNTKRINVHQQINQ